MAFAVETLSSPSGERVLTIAEQLQGEGRNEASLEIAASLLEDGMPADVVARNTKLPLDRV